MNIKESEIKLLERFKKNRIKIRLKKEDRILIIENLNYYSGLMRLGSKNLYATSNNLRPKYLPKNIKFKNSITGNWILKVTILNLFFVMVYLVISVIIKNYLRNL